MIVLNRESLILFQEPIGGSDSDNENVFEPFFSPFDIDDVLDYEQETDEDDDESEKVERANVESPKNLRNVQGVKSDVSPNIKNVGPSHVEIPNAESLETSNAESLETTAKVEGNWKSFFLDQRLKKKLKRNLRSFKMGFKTYENLWKFFRYKIRIFIFYYFNVLF